MTLEKHGVERFPIYGEDWPEMARFQFGTISTPSALVACRCLNTEMMWLTGGQIHRVWPDQSCVKALTPAAPFEGSSLKKILHFLFELEAKTSRVNLAPIRTCAIVSRRVGEATC